MKAIKILALMMMGLFTMASCGSDDDDNEKVPTEAEKVAGIYAGENKVSVVAGQTTETYAAAIEYKITSNTDNTINVEVPQYSLENTVMGNLTLGAYKVEKIPYDAATASFTKVYGTDGLTMQFKAVRVVNGAEEPMFDKAYSFTETSTITVKKTSDGLTVSNSFSLGSMPFPIVANFSGTAK